MQNISSDITNKDHSDTSDLIKIREQYTNNLVLGYLNINSLKNKIINLVDKVLIDILCIDETKLDDTFPDAQFKINNYQYPPFRRDRNQKGGGKIDKNTFFSEISKKLSLIINEYGNVIVAGDLNIDLSNTKTLSENHVSDLRDTFALTNLVKQKTCFKTVRGTLLDVILTNKPNCFQKTSAFETGLSDFHKLVVTVFRSTFKKLPPKL